MGAVTGLVKWVIDNATAALQTLPIPALPEWPAITVVQGALDLAQALFPMDVLKWQLMIWAVVFGVKVARVPIEWALRVGLGR